jgi:hypothetical protein
MHKERGAGMRPQICSRLLQPSLIEDWKAISGDGWFCGFESRPGLNAVAAANNSGMRVVMRLMDDTAATVPLAAWKANWREFLRMSNLVQFLADGVFVTSLGLQEGLYGSLIERETQAALASELQAVLENIVDQIARQITATIYAAGCILAEPGYEITKADGEIIGMAELAWPDQRVCILTPEQMEYRPIDGWTVLTTADSSALINLLPKRNA